MNLPFSALSIAAIRLLLMKDVAAIRNLRIVSPLQAFTIADAHIKAALVKTRREQFLTRFRVGLESEEAARKILKEKSKQRSQLSVDLSQPDWATKASSADIQLRQAESSFIEKARDEALKKLEALEAQNSYEDRRDQNRFQFVGVVNSDMTNKTPISWYARKKPSGSNWSVRLIHVDRGAVIKDLFSRGKVDIFGRYENSGKRENNSGQVIANCKYFVRERCWKNLWNFSPIHFFTDSSGMYWRERRLRPGLYTDGSTVYETSYRFQDGRNGMHRLSSFDQYLGSKMISSKQKEKIMQRLNNDAPDVVLEG